MKIALSTSVIQRGKTGVAQYVFTLVRSLIRQAEGHEIHLLVLEEDLPLFEFARDHVTLVPVSEKWRSPLKNVFWHQFLLPRWLKCEGIDVLHVPSYRRMVWSAPCATVATIHDLAPFHVKGKYDLARMLYGRVIVKYLARRQDAIVAVSENTSADITRFFGIPRERLRVVLNGLDHERFCPMEGTGKPTGEKPYFLYVSRLEHPAKNHVRLIEAFEGFKAATGSDWQLVLGGSDWHGAEHIHAAVKASPYRDEIRLPGFVGDAELPDLYRRAGALVYPSLFEGFGMPPVEAMACGCPVISSDAGSLGEVVGGAALIVDPLSVESIGSALARVALDEEARARLVVAGLANSRRFDWEENAKHLLRIYERAAHGPPVGGIERVGQGSDAVRVATPHAHA